MSKANNVTLFDKICSETNTWIIRYYSSTYKRSVFFIWYTDTDENSTDKLLTFKTGEVIATSILVDINEKITRQFNLLTPSENLPEWLDKSKNILPHENATYNTILLSNALKLNNLDPSTLEGLTNFRNLFSDYVHQDKNNSHLKLLLENEFVQSAWDYYYNYIFWLKLENKLIERPQLILDIKELHLGVGRIIKKFDEKIKLI